MPSPQGFTGCADSQRPLLFINDFQTQHGAQLDKAGQQEASLGKWGVERATRGVEKTQETTGSYKEDPVVSAELQGLPCVPLAPSLTLPSAPHGHLWALL